MSGKREGGCLCGSVRFHLRGPCRPVLVCHCRQCACRTGYLVAATSVSVASFEIVTGQDSLRCYRSSQNAERAFCARCSLSLFWRHDYRAHVAIMAGAFDQPGGPGLDSQVHVADCADYDVIGDALARHDRLAEMT